LADLWELDESRRSDAISPRLEQNFYARCPPEKRPHYIKEQEAFTPIDEETREKLEPDINKSETPQEDLEKNAEAMKKAYDESLAFALEKTFRYHFWLGGILQFIGGMHGRFGSICATLAN
jgi:ATP-binding cassette, subfamily C (CFTR/MRP), member 1